LLFPESRQLTDERAGAVSSWGDWLYGDGGSVARKDGGAASLPLIVSLEVGGTTFRAADLEGELEYRNRKPLQRLGEADPAFLTKRVRVAVERSKLVVKLVYYYVHDAYN
jgi:hypothetical protein